MNVTEVDLTPTFLDIARRCRATTGAYGYSLSTEAALLALEACRLGMPVPDLTALYRAWLDKP